MEKFKDDVKKVVAGVYGFFHIMANSISVGGLLAFLTVKPQFWTTYFLAMFITIGVTFILTTIYSKKNRKLIIKKELSKTE